MHHARIGRDQADAMLLAQDASIRKCRSVARRCDKMARVFDYDIRFVAVASERGRNPRKQIIDDADHPHGTGRRAIAGPVRNFLTRDTEELGWGLGFITGAERAGRYRVVNRGLIERRGVAWMMLASTKSEREAFASKIDDVRNHAAERILYP